MTVTTAWTCYNYAWILQHYTYIFSTSTIYKYFIGLNWNYCRITYRCSKACWLTISERWIYYIVSLITERRHLQTDCNYSKMLSSIHAVWRKMTHLTDGDWLPDVSVSAAAAVTSVAMATLDSPSCLSVCDTHATCWHCHGRRGQTTTGYPITGRHCCRALAALPTIHLRHYWRHQSAVSHDIITAKRTISVEWTAACFVQLNNWLSTNGTINNPFLT